MGEIKYVLPSYKRTKISKFFFTKNTHRSINKRTHTHTNTLNNTQKHSETDKNTPSRRFVVSGRGFRDAGKIELKDVLQVASCVHNVGVRREEAVTVGKHESHVVCKLLAALVGVCLELALWCCVMQCNRTTNIIMVALNPRKLRATLGLDSLRRYVATLSCCILYLDS